MLENRKVGKEIIDRGWNEMSAILDVEMPVDRGNRKVIFIWLLGLVFIGVVIGGMWWSLSANGDSGRLNDIPEKSTKFSPSIVTVESNDGVNELSLSDGGQNVDADTEIPGSVVPVPVEENEDADIYSDPRKFEKKGAEKRNAGISGYTDIKQDENQDQNKSNIVNIDASTSTSGEILDQGNLSNEMTASRSKLGFNLIPQKGNRIKWNYTFSNDLEIEPLKEDKLSGWMVYTNSRVIDYEHFNLESGVGYEWNLFSDFSLIPQIGYGWDQIRYTSALAPGGAIEFSADNGLDAERFLSSVSNRTKGNFISLGLDVSYNLGRKWQLYTGINYRLLTASLGLNAEDEELLDNSASQDPEPSGVARINVNHDLYYRMGLSRHITRELSLGAYFYTQLNNPYDVFINGVQDSEATSQFFPRRKTMNVFLNYRF